MDLSKYQQYQQNLINLMLKNNEILKNFQNTLKDKNFFENNKKLVDTNPIILNFLNENDHTIIENQYSWIINNESYFPKYITQNIYKMMIDQIESFVFFFNQQPNLLFFKYYNNGVSLIQNFNILNRDNYQLLYYVVVLINVFNKCFFQGKVYINQIKKIPTLTYFKMYDFNIPKYLNLTHFAELPDKLEFSDDDVEYIQQNFDYKFLMGLENISLQYVSSNFQNLYSENILNYLDETTNISEETVFIKKFLSNYDKVIKINYKIDEIVLSEFNNLQNNSFKNNSNHGKKQFKDKKNKNKNKNKKYDFNFQDYI